MKKIKWIIITLSLLLLVIIINYINKDNYIDTIIYQHISSYINPVMTKIAKAITAFGNGVIIILIYLILLITFKRKKDKIFLSINLLTIFILNQIIKLIIARPRPTINPLIMEKGYSFPSGHAMISLGFYGFIIYLIYRNIKNNKIKWPLIIGINLLILLIGISRIYLGVHYFTDICGGYLIAIIYLIVLIEIYEGEKNEK